MSRAFDARFYLDLIGSSIVPFNFTCRCCGASSYTTSAQHETFCNFCEFYVNLEAMNAVQGSADAKKNLLGMNNAAQRGQWLQGVPYADALAATKDPFFLYGVSHFYRFFSDFTYYDVNYNLGGFMYSNADKRSDELLKNKYNAMALISRSKEYLFKALKVISTAPSDAKLVYLKFMCNMKLKRYALAASNLTDLYGLDDAVTISKYAKMIFTIETASKIPILSKLPDINSASGSANFFYYVAKHIAKAGDLYTATAILNSVNDKIYMPMAVSYNRRITEVNSALGF
jgi:hypothetical protein